jgi:SMP-30/Gluconolactonase/LRE-like region
VLIEFAVEVGDPDGLTVHADGDLWVAIYGGGRVHRYAPDGAVISGQRFRLPRRRADRPPSVQEPLSAAERSEARSALRPAAWHRVSRELLDFADGCERVTFD